MSNSTSITTQTNSTTHRTADVYIQGVKAGQLSETDDGYEFRYLTAYLESSHPLSASLTLPLQKTPYTSKTIFAFFDGLIPEGWLLSVVKKHWHIPEKDRFGVLLVACRDCIGDVQIVKKGETL